MNKEIYIRELLAELGDVSEKEREQIREFFEEMILDRIEAGEKQEDIMASLGTPKEAAGRLRKAEQEEQIAQGHDLAADPSDIHSDGEGTYENGADAPTPASGNEVLAVQIRTDMHPVEICRYDGERVQIVYDARESIETVTETFSQGVLSFRQKVKSWKIWKIWNYSWRKSICVKLPMDFAGKVQIFADAAPITLRKIGVLKELSVQTGNAKIEIFDLKAESLLAHTSNAQILAERISAKSGILRTTNARIEVTDMDGEHLSFTTSNNRICLTQVTAHPELCAKTSNGALKVDRLEADHISLRTSNGPVSGFIAGVMEDYDIISSTGFARNNLPERKATGKEKQLEVKTSNGKIQLEFEDM